MEWVVFWFLQYFMLKRFLSKLVYTCEDFLDFLAYLKASVRNIYILLENK